jgi:hypothetical protein
MSLWGVCPPLAGTAKSSLTRQVFELAFTRLQRADKVSCHRCSKTSNTRFSWRSLHSSADGSVSCFCCLRQVLTPPNVRSPSPLPMPCQPAASSHPGNHFRPGTTHLTGTWSRAPSSCHLLGYCRGASISNVLMLGGRRVRMTVWRHLLTTSPTPAPEHEPLTANGSRKAAACDNEYSCAFFSLKKIQVSAGWTPVCYFPPQRISQLFFSCSHVHK